jgi:hypothetical protein
LGEEWFERLEMPEKPERLERLIVFWRWTFIFLLTLFKVIYLASQAS